MGYPYFFYLHIYVMISQTYIYIYITLFGHVVRLVTQWSRAMSGPDLIITLSYFYFKLQLFYEESKKEYILQVVISKV